MATVLAASGTSRTEKPDPGAADPLRSAPGSRVQSARQRRIATVSEMVINIGRLAKAGPRVQIAHANWHKATADGNEASVTTPDQFKSEMIGLLPRLRRFALSLTRSVPDADDLVQDACAAALQKWHQYDPGQPLDRWMFRIIRNLWISEIRKRQVRHGQGHVAAEEATELQTGDADDALTARQVQGKVSALPAELSRPLMLVCAEGYSYLEVSQLLEIPVGTVMSRIHRARKLLVSTLGQGDRVTS